jgi:hypothetical protein
MLAAMLAGSASAAPPAGWMSAGMAPQDYEMGVDKSVTYGGKPSAYIRSAKPTPSGFSTLMQMFTAVQYRGQRVRFSAQVKSDAVTHWAGLWLRVDGRDAHSTAFDNMQDRPISGTTSWKHYEVVLDVADEATNVALGILLDGPGTVWMSDIKFETVDKTVATTGQNSRPNDGPTNLDFTK